MVDCSRILDLFCSLADAQHSAVLALHLCNLNDASSSSNCWIGKGYPGDGDTDDQSETYYLFDGQFIKKYYDGRFEATRVPKTQQSIKDYHLNLFKLTDLITAVETKNGGVSVVSVLEKIKADDHKASTQDCTK